MSGPFELSLPSYVACDLLSAGELTVSEVAERLGYHEVSNFSRAFRRWFGVSPGERRGQRLLTTGDNGVPGV